jgi:hypothetical protein
MGTLAFSRHAVSISVPAALLAACGGSEPPIGAPGALQESRALGMRADWSAETANYKLSGPLLYVTNGGIIYSAVTIYEAKQRNPKIDCSDY